MPQNAKEIALKYMSPRYLRLDMLEQYYEGTQYAGRAPFMATDEAAPPMMERAPCVVYGMPKIAIGDLVDFMLGEDRYPHVSAGSSEDDEDLDDDWGLNEDDSSLLERWINGPLTKSARLKAVFPEALTMSMKACSVAIVASMQRGYPCLEAMPAKWCTPTFDPRTKQVTSLEIKYPYIVEEQSPTDPLVWEEKCKLYRRVIDTKTDTVYLPGEGRDDGREPNWQADPAQTMVHGLGFCPVHWYAFERGEPTAANFDGNALHQYLGDELDALNFSLSMRHRAALYTGDPQIWETGVDEITNPAPAGRAPRVSIEPIAKGPDGRPVGIFTTNPRNLSNRQGMRKKGPGVVWRYPEATSKVGMLSLPGDALDGISGNSDDIRKKLSEDMSVVLIDPTDVKTMGALSGKALSFMFSRQIARCDRIRQDAGDKLMLACIDLLLRMCMVVAADEPRRLRIPGISKAVAVLQKFARDVEVLPAVGTPEGTPKATAKEWFGPRLELEWGPYFQSSAEEENFLVTMCVAAYSSKLMPLEVVLEKLRSVFSFGSTEELMDRLEEEAQKAADQQAAALEATTKVGVKYAPGQRDGPPWPPNKMSASGAKGDTKA